MRGEARMKEHKNYQNGKPCEFRADGKLRGGVALEDLDTEWLLGYYGPKYREITLDKNAVELY